MTAQFTLDTSGLFTMHKRGCAHTKMKHSDFAVDVDGPTYDRAGAIAALDSLGTFRLEGTTLAFAPCLRGLPGGTHDEVSDPDLHDRLYPNRKVKR